MPAMKQAFQRLGGRTLIAWDGTEYFNSYKIGCSNCLTRKRKTTETFRYRWIENVPIRDGKDAMLVNWVGSRFWTPMVKLNTRWHG